MAELDEACALDRRLGARGEAAHVLAHLAWVLRAVGDYGRALEIGQEAVASAEELTHAWWLGWTASVHGWTLLDLGAIAYYTGDEDAVLSETKRAFAASAVVLTLGEQGAAWLSDHDSGRVPACPTTIIDRLGAGDAFMAGVIEGLLTDDFERGVKYSCTPGSPFHCCAPPRVSSCR